MYFVMKENKYDFIFFSSYSFRDKIRGDLLKKEIESFSRKGNCMFGFFIILLLFEYYMYYMIFKIS